VKFVVRRVNDRILKERFSWTINWKAAFLSAALLCVPASLLAQGSSAPAASLNINLNYKIGPGDVIDVIVSKNETLSRSGLRVTNQGTIQLPMLDTDLPAACMTERQLADTIKERYRKYLVDPYVNVAVREFNASPVAVIGAVNAPGRFQLQRQYRLVELLALVNGPSASAGTSAEILRYGNLPYCDGSKLIVPVEPREELLSIVLDDAFKGGDAANPIVMAGDIVRVSTADQTNAYIQGLVKSSMTIPLNKEPVTLTQAIAMAGGVTEGAQLDKVLIRRPIPGSVNRSDVLVNVKEIRQGKRDDVLLQPNDIVEVPGATGAKKIFSDIFKKIIPSLTNLPMRVIY
jgi:polysaccharide export outer membrane protein